MTDAEIRKSGRRALAAKYPMNQVSRAYEKGETQGFIKICADAELATYSRVVDIERTAIMDARQALTHEVRRGLIRRPRC